MVTIWGRPGAYNVQKVLWFIHELGLVFTHVDVGSVAGDLDSKEFLAMNPHGRVPLIKDNDSYIWESNTILRYLAASYGAEHYWSSDPLERSLLERWMDWELATLQVDFLSLFWKYYRTPQDLRDNKAIVIAQQRCDRNVIVLEQQLSAHPFVAGERFSLADICVGTSFYRYFNMGIDVPVLPNVLKWYKKLSTRPAYQKIIQIPFDDLKGRQSY